MTVGWGSWEATLTELCIVRSEEAFPWIMMVQAIHLRAVIFIEITLTCLDH